MIHRSPRCELSRSWEYGPFVNFGNGVGGDRSQFRFFAAGVQAGKILTPPLHAGILSGQFELARTSCRSGRPTHLPRTIRHSCFRADLHRSRWRRNLHWREHHACYLSLEFPYALATHSALVPGRRRPHLHHAQVSAGYPGASRACREELLSGISRRKAESEFTTSPVRKRSIDLGFNAVHISSASLGDRNPGVNALWQIQLGYTFWK